MNGHDGNNGDRIERMRDRLHDLQLFRDLQAVNERTCRELGPPPTVGWPIEPKRKPNTPRTAPRVAATSEGDAMKISHATAATIIGVVGTLAACDSRDSVNGDGGYGASSSALTVGSDLVAEGQNQDDGVPEPGNGGANVGYGIRPEFWTCTQLGSWPEAAECISAERDHQDERLGRAYNELLDNLDEPGRSKAAGANAAWKLLQDEDESLEALLFDHLGSVGYFESARNEVIRRCERADQIEDYSTAIGGRTVSIEASLDCAPNRSRCSSARAIDSNARLSSAYEKLLSLSGTDLRDQIAKSRHTWKKVQALDDAFERSIQYPNAGHSRNIRTCQRADQIEKYVDLVNSNALPHAAEGDQS
jgi:uncharacterized protein YecT (DUF1311 family)